LALYELQAGDFEKSSALIAAALMLHPDYPPALLARGRWLLAQGKPSDAVESLEHAAQLNPLPEYHWVLLEALQAAGRKDEATRVAGLLQQRGTADDPRTYALYLATSKQDSAIALQLARDELAARADVFTLDAVAWANQAAGRTSEAREFSLRALGEGTEDGRLFLHAAVIAQAAGDHAEAVRFRVKANALQQMLLPSEKEILTSLPNDRPIVANLQSH
jgi:tetratricopeptide (TPR) repeat protein